MSLKQEPEYKDLRLNEQQLSHIVAALLLVAFFIFIGGYYWGKKSALEPFADQLESDSLADKVSYAFFTLYDQQEQDDEEAIQKEQDAGDIAQAVSPEPQENKVDELVQEAQASKGLYYAELAGFGTAKAAQACVDQLRKKGFRVRSVMRESKNAHGKIITWYQVLTEPSESEEKLLRILEELKNTRGCIAKTATFTIKKMTKE